MFCFYFGEARITYQHYQINNRPISWRLLILNQGFADLFHTVQCTRALLFDLCLVHWLPRMPLVICLLHRWVTKRCENGAAVLSLPMNGALVWRFSDGQVLTRALERVWESSALEGGQILPLPAISASIRVRVTKLGKWKGTPVNYKVSNFGDFG